MYNIFSIMDHHQVNRFTEPFIGSSRDEEEDEGEDEVKISASIKDEHVATVDFRRSLSNINDELWQFRVGLMWLGLQHLSTNPKHICSWILFLLFSVLIPLCSICLVDCHSCDKSQKHPFKVLVQISESGLSLIGFLSLSGHLRTYGLRKMLFLDQMGKESPQVQLGYQDQLQDSFRLLLKVLLPCFMVELVHKIMWFRLASVEIPLISDSNELAKNVIMCFLMMLSWLYRAAVFLLMCVLFRVICTLQILRFKGFYKLLESTYAHTTHCSLILKEHMRIRDQLIIMSHRFRIFLLSSLITITLTQIVSLFIITARSGPLTFPELGDFAVCSATQVIGFVLCLHGAAKITHTGHRIVSFVSLWHAVSSCMESSSNNGVEGSPIIHVESNEDLEAACKSVVAGELPRPPIKYNPRTYFRRQALVSYFQHCKGSITIYGFAVDRGSIYGIFVLELSLLLWTLGKTIAVAPSH